MNIECYINPRMHDTKIARAAERNDLCAGLSDELAQILLLNETAVTMPKGTQLVSQGNFVQHLIILKSGALRLSLPCTGCDVSWTIDRAGQILGMRSIISGEPSETNITCIRQCDVGLFDRSFFLGMLKIHPELYFAVSRILSFDLKIANRMLLNKRQGTAKEIIPKTSQWLDPFIC